jgi:hypothetical protein
MVCWEHGRQGTGYLKHRLASAMWPIPWDVYLLKFPPGSHIPRHRDLSVLGRHYRLNVTLWNAHPKHPFQSTGWLWRGFGRRVVLFRPDIHAHAVRRIEIGTRYVLSFGWLCRDRDGRQPMGSGSSEVAEGSRRL